jgi:hypothetical protein
MKNNLKFYKLLSETIGIMFIAGAVNLGMANDTWTSVTICLVIGIIGIALGKIDNPGSIQSSEKEVTKYDRQTKSNRCS